MYTVKKKTPNSGNGQVVVLNEEESNSESDWTDTEEDEPSSDYLISDEDTPSDGSNSDSEDENDSGCVFNMPNSAELDLEESLMKSAINKIRAISKLFRKSVPRNNRLQKQIQKDRQDIENKRGKRLSGRLNLLLDLKIRWSSLLPMMQRFMDLRPSIEKTLIDLRPKLTKKQKEKAT
ncbi:unnamed protein product, partial [Allacma fusca]